MMKRERLSKETVQQRALHHELGGRVTPPATVATGVRADPKGHGLGGRGSIYVGFAFLRPVRRLA